MNRLIAGLIDSFLEIEEPVDKTFVLFFGTLTFGMLGLIVLGLLSLAKFVLFGSADCGL